MGEAGSIVLTKSLDATTSKCGLSAIKSSVPIESAQNLLFGKPKSDQLSCQQTSMFDPQKFEKSSPDSSEVLRKRNAVARITEEYGTLEHSKFD